MSALSPADRAFRAFTRLGALVALVLFLMVGSDVLLGQWITGYASAIYIFGTAALLAGICVGLFALIAAIGLAVAFAFRQPAEPETPPVEDEGPMPGESRTERSATLIEAVSSSQIDGNRQAAA
jgi:hypothetical protein